MPPALVCSSLALSSTLGVSVLVSLTVCVCVCLCVCVCVAGSEGKRATACVCGWVGADLCERIRILACGTCPQPRPMRLLLCTRTTSTACSWTTYTNQYSDNYANGISTIYGLEDAKAKCLDLGSAVCPAVTCSSSGACTVRAGSSLTASPSNEISYVPSAACYTSGMDSPWPVHFFVGSRYIVGKGLGGGDGKDVEERGRHTATKAK